jgi:hypothetical protein
VLGSGVWPSRPSTVSITSFGVTRPWMSPYSSTTSAIGTLASRNFSSAVSAGADSGRNSGG